MYEDLMMAVYANPHSEKGWQWCLKSKKKFKPGSRVYVAELEEGPPGLRFSQDCMINGGMPGLKVSEGGSIRPNVTREGVKPMGLTKVKAKRVEGFFEVYLPVNGPIPDDLKEEPAMDTVMNETLKAKDGSEMAPNLRHAINLNGGRGKYNRRVVIMNKRWFPGDKWWVREGDSELPTFLISVVREEGFRKYIVNENHSIEFSGQRADMLPMDIVSSRIIRRSGTLIEIMNVKSDKDWF